MDSLITIASFTDPIKANLIKAKLKSEGIPSFLMDENTVSLLPIYSFAFGNIKLKVHKKDVGKAREVLKNSQPNFTDEFKIFDENADKPSPKCPNCLSTNIYKNEWSRTSILGFLIVGFPIPIFNNKFKCFECGYQWKEKVKP